MTEGQDRLYLLLVGNDQIPMPIRELLKHCLTQSGYKNMSVAKMQPFSDNILCNKEGWTEEWDEMVNATFASGTGMTISSCQGS